MDRSGDAIDSVARYMDFVRSSVDLLIDRIGYRIASSTVYNQPYV